MSAGAVKTVTWVLLAVWGLFAFLFVLKLHNAFDHPLANRNPGGLLFLVSQAALGAVVILRLQGSGTDTK